MTPDFARVIDPIFLTTISLLDQIERNQAPDASVARIGIEYRINQAEQAVGRSNEQWMLAKYAIVAWIDEVLIDAPWEGRTDWKNSSLEYDLFGGATAHETFYVKAEEAKGLAARDALEVFYVCVILGFRGLYRKPTDNKEAARLGLPDSLAQWAERAEMAIDLKRGRPDVSAAPQTGAVAQPLYGRSNFLVAALTFVCMAAITLFLSFLYLNW